MSSGLQATVRAFVSDAAVPAELCQQVNRMRLLSCSQRSE
jgi:hypothetical protein